MHRYTLSAVTLGLCVVQTLSGCGDNDTLPPDSSRYQAEIVRTQYGIPHITADDWGSLGYGYGYAYAQDNYCVLMAEVVRAQGQAALYLDGPASIGQDAVFRYYNRDARIASEFLTGQPAYVIEIMDGLVAGFNRYLQETGSDALADGEMGCRNAPWVRPITRLDLAKVYHKLGLKGSTEELADFIAATAAPAEVTADNPALVPENRISADIAIKELKITPESLGIGDPGQRGSNAIAAGADASQGEYGVLLGNPHFPWSGIDRFYQVHLTLPGQYDAMGATLQGVAAVQIGFNEDLAWTHTASEALRFTFFDIPLSPEDPMKYVVEGEEYDIVVEDIVVQVRGEDGSVEDLTHRLYFTHLGPIVNLSIIDPQIGSWPTVTNSVIAMADANLSNNRLFHQWVRLGQSKSVEELEEALEILGIPWVNTLAVDRQGNAFYGDVGAVPNISPEQVALCATTPLSALLTAQGLVTLDGSRDACRWGDAPQTPAGILAFEDLPRQTTRSYVANANDSYWLSNPDSTLEGYSPVLGGERYPQSIRTRHTFAMCEARLAGSDDLGPPGFSAEAMAEIMFANDVHAADLALDDILTICQNTADWSVYTDAVADAMKACEVLGTWDRRFDADSRGSHLFSEVWSRISQLPELWVVPFDPADPVDTPRDLNDGAPAVDEATRAAIAEVAGLFLSNGLDLDAPLSALQYRTVDGERIPIHGGPETIMFSAINSTFVANEGWTNLAHGNSYIQIVTWDDSACPDARALLTYSQSTDPASPFYADQTQAYADKEWNRLPFCTDDVAEQAVSITLIEE